ncbi:MAG: hypothetical protein GYA41_12385 [Bacteroidales bacterium]|nr:hypothetical protein [Bacteroidales bacterium]
MEKIKHLTAKALYGTLFVAAVPLFLVLWAHYTEEVVSLPVPLSRSFGYILIIAGFSVLVIGIYYIMTVGKGLPMNAFPPEKFVKNGIYSVLKHPIYTGAVLISFGVSAVAQSASGFWLVSPVFVLLVTAFVAGFENERTLAVFGPQDYKTFFSLPDDSDEKPAISDRITTYVFACLPVIILFWMIRYKGASADSLPVRLDFEKAWPASEVSAVLFLFTFIPFLIVPIVAKTKQYLRNYTGDMLFGSITAGLLYFVFPLSVERIDFTPQTFAGGLIMSLRQPGVVDGALAGISIFCTLIPLKYLAPVSGYKSLIWYFTAALFLFSGITSGNYSLISSVAGLLIFILIIFRTEIWNSVRMLSERIANSWKEWRFGSLRIINHGFYGGASGFAGMLIAGFFLGKEAFTGFFVVVIMIIGAGLWAQVIEGSSKLLRPYGYYGGLVGGMIACVLVSLLTPMHFFYILGAFAIAAPWIQCFGRLRCLVQGCCHGKPSGRGIGLRFDHPKSRVNKISGLKGVYLHPTQLYSIGTNIVTGLILIRLFSLGMPSAFICGIYMILNGTGRFVEEAFRGEAQTPYWMGMRIYQWIAVANILTGIVFTLFTGTEPLVFRANIESLYLAVISGIIVTFASGADFPESDRRFARLTS